jgi:hypothetical protein
MAERRGHPVVGWVIAVVTVAGAVFAVGFSIGHLESSLSCESTPAGMTEEERKDWLDECRYGEPSGGDYLRGGLFLLGPPLAACLLLWVAWRVGTGHWAGADRAVFALGRRRQTPGPAAVVSSAPPVFVPYSAEPIRLGHVRSGGAALRDQPGEGQVIRNLVPGTRVVVREWRGGFAYVFVDGGDRGWLYRTDLAEPAPKASPDPGAQAAVDGEGGR